MAIVLFGENWFNMWTYVTGNQSVCGDQEERNS